MSINLRTRALVFSTFFGSCIAIALLLVSLTTNHWVDANPRRNTTESKGEISYGLFYGNKDLNSGFGWRTQTIDVYTFIRTEQSSTSFWLWLLTALGTGFGLLSCAIAAIAAVLKAASAAKKQGTMFVLFLSNISSAIAQIIAFVCWFIQFYQYLTHNVLLKEDKPHWYSDGLASLGYSFYLVIISTVVVILNIIILWYAKRSDYHDRQRLNPVSEEKNQGAIMLY